MIEKFHGSDPMIDVISEDYRMLLLLSRFGIPLGFGDQTVMETCTGAGVDTQTFLTVVNYIKAGTHVHVGDLAQRINLPCLVRYLKRSHTYFTDYRIPELRRKLLGTLDMTLNNQIAPLILKFFDESAREVAMHMEYEDKYVHGHIGQLLQNRLPAESFYRVVRNRHVSHDSIEKSFSELKDVIMKYYPGDADAHVLNDVVMDVYMLEEDLLSHCRLEDTLLAECVRVLEDEVRDRGGDPVDGETETHAEEEAADLSLREQEVLRRVAMGMSNKEIADKMFISVNTVMTHRRNIVRKTGIHAAAGLAIYAIVHGIVSVDELKG